MTFWLMNLVRSMTVQQSNELLPANAMELVAVITSSFQVIREESRTSAFTIDEQ